MICPRRRRNVEHKSARQLLRLERRDNCLLFRRSARTGRRHWHERLCVRDRRQGKQPQRNPQIPQSLADSSASHLSNPNLGLSCRAKSRDLIIISAGFLALRLRFGQNHSKFRRHCRQINAAAKSGALLRPTFGQCLPWLRSPQRLPGGVDSRSRTAVATSFSGSGSRPGNRRECFLRLVFS